MNKSKNRLKLALATAACCTITGCAQMNNAQVNNAQVGAAGGAVAGGVGGYMLSKVLCKDQDVACRNRAIVTGAVAGGVVGYITGQERDLQIAQQAAEELRRLGNPTQIETRMVEVDVPVDAATNQEISNEQLPTYPKERVVQRKKQVRALSSMTVELKNRNDAAERTRVSNYLLEKANQMSGRQELVVPADAPRSERIALMQAAKQKNVLVRQTKGANSISLASL